MGFPIGSEGKESACNEGRPGFYPSVRKIPWRREWQPTLIFLPIKFHEQRSLADYSTRGCKELDTTEQIILKVNPCKSVLRIMLLY